VKRLSVGHLSRQADLDRMTLLIAHDFDLSKKVFFREDKTSTSYFQATTPQEDRALRLGGLEHFFIARRNSGRVALEQVQESNGKGVALGEYR
jgi:hypothetical protein